MVTTSLKCSFNMELGITFYLRLLVHMFTVSSDLGVLILIFAIIVWANE